MTKYIFYFIHSILLSESKVLRPGLRRCQEVESFSSTVGVKRCKVLPPWAFSVLLGLDLSPLVDASVLSDLSHAGCWLWRLIER